MKRYLFLFLFLFLFLVACNLSDDGPQLPTSKIPDATIKSDAHDHQTECKAHSDCEEGFLCKVFEAKDATGFCTPLCTQDEDCDGGVCDQTPLNKGLCIERPPNSRRSCERCVSDTECKDEKKCIPLRYYETGSVGFYCMPPMQDGCGRPMIAKKQSVSLGGVADTYCTINEEVQTCDTILRFQRECGSNENCAGGGYCVSKQCTYECKATEECLGDTECKAFANMKMAPAICAP